MVTATYSPNVSFAVERSHVVVPTNFHTQLWQVAVTDMCFCHQAV